MQDHADASVTAFASDASYAQEQRQALRDLLRLSAECTQAQEQIEQQAESVRETAQVASSRLERRLQYRHQRLRNGVQAHWQARIEKLQARAEQELARVEHIRNAANRGVIEEAEATEHKTRQKLEQALWLADSMHEAAVVQAQKDEQQVKDRIEADRDKLLALASQAEAALKLYALAPEPIQQANLKPPPDSALASDVEGDPSSESDAAYAYNRHHDSAEQAIKRLRNLFIPSLMRGFTPVAALLTVCAAVLLGAWLLIHERADLNPTHQLAVYGGTFGATVVVMLTLIYIGRRLAKKHLRAAYQPVHANLEDAHRDLEQRVADARLYRRQTEREAERQRRLEREKVTQRYQPALEECMRHRKASLAKNKAHFDEHKATLERKRDEKLKAMREASAGEIETIDARYAKYLELARYRYAARIESSDERLKREQAELEQRWTQGIERIEAVVQQSERIEAERFPGWDETHWQQWQPPKEHTALVRFGSMHVDMRQVASEAAKQGRYRLKVPRTFNVPALLTLPKRGSLLIETDPADHEAAIALLHTVMARLLTTLPPGQVRFTLIDPVGLGQSFAGFMHLADIDDKLVGGRIWTEQEHIERRLGDLTTHMENVIQKYLRNEFATIDEYNAQADELAEPYRFVVIADYPHGFSDEAVRRLNSIVTSGPRCGVYALVVRDMRQSVPGGLDAEDLQRNSAHLVYHEGKLTWEDDVFRRFPLTIETPPSEQQLTAMLSRVGEQAREAMHVEVPFSSIAPPADKWWSLNTADVLHVPLGRTGATRRQELRLGEGMAQHVLMAGKTGSGKSTLLHVLVTNLALWYSPDEVEFYLIDFKKGVEFKTYASHALPHARVVAIESDREFGLSVLQRLDAELERRGQQFRAAGVQNLADFRAAQPKVVMPRTLLIVDEFQELFSEDDKISSDAALLIDRLVRQGRAFGIHVLLGSQTLAGSSGLARSTMGQMAVRVAMQCSEADAQLIFDDHNAAARLLSRPGEAIYNDAGGMVEGNSPFQVAWLGEAERETYLAQTVKLAASRGVEHEPTIVFEGSADADVAGNRPLARLLSATTWPTNASAGEPQAWLGDPITIKPPTAVTFPRRSGANVIIVGQRDEAATALLSTSVVSLASQHAAGDARFVIFDGTPADAPWAGHFKQVADALPHEVQIVPFRESEQAMAELAELLAQRQNDADAAQDGPSVYVLVNGLQRYRMLRRSEDEFSFSLDDDAEKGVSADKQFATLLREGPSLGIHVLAWCETATALDRTLERTAMREFDQRVLFQMSANDSSNLIDSPAANKLGLTRALVYSEEKGVVEKFRPYALPAAAWLQQVASNLQRRTASTPSSDGSASATT